MRTKGCMLNMEKDKRKWYRVFDSSMNGVMRKTLNWKIFTIEIGTHSKNKILIHFYPIYYGEINESID